MISVNRKSAAGGAPTFGNTLLVDADGNTDYSDINAGVDAAVSGDTVVVKPGTYTDTGIDIGAGIQVYFEPGAEIVVNSTTPIFDSTNNGQDTAILGYGKFENTGAVDNGVKIGGTDFVFECDSIDCPALNAGKPALEIQSDGDYKVLVREVVDSSEIGITLANGGGHVELNNLVSGGIGINLALSENTHITFNKITSTGNAISGSNTAGIYAFIQGQEIQSAAKIYNFSGSQGFFNIDVKYGVSTAGTIAMDLVCEGLILNGHYVSETGRVINKMPLRPDNDKIVKGLYESEGTDCIQFDTAGATAGTAFLNGIFRCKSTATGNVISTFHSAATQKFYVTGRVEHLSVGSADAVSINNSGIPSLKDCDIYLAGSGSSVDAGAARDCNIQNVVSNKASGANVTEKIETITVSADLF